MNIIFLLESYTCDISIESGSCVICGMSQT